MNRWRGGRGLAGGTAGAALGSAGAASPAGRRGGRCAGAVADVASITVRIEGQARGTADGALAAGRPVGRTVTVRPMRAADAAAVLAVYQTGLDTGEASFETVAPDWAAFDAGRLPAHRFVAVEPDGTVVGWVAVSAVSGRCVYAGVVEHSVYVHPAARGRGVGRALLAALIASTEAAGVWTIQSGVFPENVASLALHERMGFRRVGVRERLGRHAARGNRWRDVVLIERRSPVVT